MTTLREIENRLIDSDVDLNAIVANWAQAFDLPASSIQIDALVTTLERRVAELLATSPMNDKPKPRSAANAESSDAAMLRDDYILNWIRPGITVEQQIREVLPLAAGELGNDYAGEAHIRASRYTHDVRWLLGEIDRLRAERAASTLKPSEGR